MTRREARMHALKTAWEALNKALDAGPEGDINNSPDDQLKIENELDHITQMMYERYARAKERIGK